ncbi:MAG: hypothetical protein DDT40_01694 [candidate division WS2 bacterium]|nr:hypothetical protein [Candidatus Psychracetigena formicireducens]
MPAEKELDFSAEYTGFNGRKVKWTTPESGVSPTGPFDKGYIDIYKTFGVRSQVISLAVTYIKSPESREAAIKFGADYWARVILNGQEIFHPEIRPLVAPVKGEVTIPVTLTQGENILLIKNHAGSGGNGFWISITDPGDLEFSSKL